MGEERGDGVQNVDLRAKLKDLLPKGVDGLEDSERRRAYTLAGLQFETFVSEVLRATLESTDLIEDRTNLFSSPRDFDLVSNVSINDLPPPIAFEIKFLRNSQQMAATARDVRSRVASSDARIRTLVLVTNYDPTQKDRQVLRESRDIAERFRYEWWGPEKLQDLIERLEEEGARIVNTLPIAGLGAALRGVFLGTVDTWKAARTSIVNELREAWRDDQLVMFLGAGVSIGAGVPPWGSLLGTLYGRLFQEIAPAPVKSAPADAVESLLSLQGNSPLMSARMLRSGLGGKFNEAVRAALYNSVEPLNSKELAEIARLCDPPRGRTGARAVVTYNFDNLLEQHLDSLNVRYLSICTGNSRAKERVPPAF